jgi:hypothetical protein
VRAYGNNTVQNTENHNHNLSDEIPFGYKNQRRYAQEGGNQAQGIKILTQARRHRD